MDWTMLGGGGFFLSDRMVLDPIGFKLPGEPHIQSAVGLGVGGLPGVWKASQEVGCRNLPPIPEKPTHFQVGPLDAWSTGCDRDGACRLAGPRCEGRMNLGNQD